jgi:AraC family transcriptional regulator, regulatory protein of adaptative response / DNA-3-methyladenine glycosylase II
VRSSDHAVQSNESRAVRLSETEFDPAICWDAIAARDRRFDGRFFAGVITTKVYCRPVCPIPLRKPENVKWFLSAASAEADGFRPCRRCRPHTSPGTPAWHGTVAVVSRAIRLIEAGALDRGSVDELAEHVGIGSRHLRRLFAEHLGAAPIELANARRLRLACHLLRDTGLPFNKVAFSAGFQSIRQFNHAIRSSFARSPSELRRSKNFIDTYEPDDEIRLHLSFRPPLDWPAMLRFYRAHSTPGIESVDDRCYRRTIQLGNAAGFMEVMSDTHKYRLLVRVRLSAFDPLTQLAERVRRMFDLRADPRPVSDHLVRDRRLRSTVISHPGLRVAGVWDTFELAVLAILGQRLGHSTITSAVRLVRAFGQPIGTSMPFLTHLFPLPEVLAKADLASIGIKPAQAEQIRALAGGCRDGRIPLTATLPRLDEAAQQYVAMRTLGDPNILSVGDYVVRSLLTKNQTPLSKSEVRQVAAQWRPWDAYAAMYRWIADAEGRDAAMLSKLD